MHAGDALERRIVTVLFADLVGFTTLSEQLDAEDVAAIQDRYFGAVRETIARYGGTLEKFIGDAAMAVFGVPIARDDDAERAVRAGLALVSAVQQLGAALGLEEDALRLRVGINTGEAVVAAGGENEGRVTGDTVNTAARFQTAAPVGGVLIGSTTALAVADVAELGDEQRLELKGKAEPVAARIVTGLRVEASREQAMGALRAPTVGREAELGALTSALDGLGDRGSERWLVVAPPGVGKSRLLREFAAAALARARTVVWRARSRPVSVTPFETISELLTAALGGSGIEGLRAALAAAGVARSRAEIIERAFERDPSTEDRDALFGAWLDGLDAMAAGATQVWLVEDVHWAGGDVLAFLEAATSRAAAHGRLIVATSRPSLLEAREDWATEDEKHHVLRLATLEASDATQLVTALVGDALPDALVARLVQRSDGNCLFIEELLRTWVSVGTLVSDGEASGGWRLAVAAEDVPLPQSVQQIYAAQLDDLPPDARRVARRASVAGRRFPVRALEPLDVADTGLEPLRRRELVTGPVDEPLLGDAYAYRHALLRDAGYASLARAERARLHARLAHWLEQAAGERSSEVAEQIAGHYAAALESAPALAASVDDGLDRVETRRRAADWYERAGQAALSLSAHDAARELLRRSIDLTPEDDLGHLAHRWEQLGDATAYAADMSEGGAAYERAVELFRASLATARTADTMDGLARAIASLADVQYQQLRFEGARDMAAAALDELPDAGPGSRARLYEAMAMGALGAFGPSQEIEAQLQQALELADESGDAHLMHVVRRSLAALRSESGRGSPETWQQIAREAMALGDVSGSVGASMNAVMGSVDDAPRDIQGTLDSVRETAVAHAMTEELGWISYTEAEAAFASGDWDRALERCAAAMDLGEANGYLRMTVRTIHVAVPIAAARADRAVLERAARWYGSLEGKFDFPDSPYARVIRPAQDLALADFGLWPRYVPEVEPRLASFNDGPGSPSSSAALDRVVRAWVEAGELDGAERALDGMASYLASAVAPTSALGLGTYSLMRARVAAARGDVAGAVTAATEALAQFRISDAPWWKAKAIRLLERVGGADHELVAEVEQIERALGSAAPTP